MLLNYTYLAQTYLHILQTNILDTLHTYIEKPYHM